MIGLDFRGEDKYLLESRTRFYLLRQDEVTSRVHVLEIVRTRPHPSSLSMADCAYNVAVQ